MSCPEYSHKLTENSIYDRVLIRLPKLNPSTELRDTLSSITYDVMWQLEPCFNIKQEFPDEPNNIDPDRVGVEANYSEVQKAIIADLVAINYLYYHTNSGNYFTATENTPAEETTFLKKAKSGNSEVEYDDYDPRTLAYSKTAVNSLIMQLKNTATNKAFALGCFIDICSDCTIQWLDRFSVPVPFVVVPPSNCHNCGG